MTTLEEIFGIKKSHSKTLKEQAGRESLKLHPLKLRDTSSLSGKPDFVATALKSIPIFAAPTIKEFPILFLASPRYAKEIW